MYLAGPRSKLASVRKAKREEAQAFLARLPRRDLGSVSRLCRLLSPRESWGRWKARERERKEERKKEREKSRRVDSCE